ncbi:AbiH family protein [Enterococcus mundtii]|uniref:AbiH family protein n=1 Tax=Enterococcus mundtii TaxID=53346 RepID=UPI00403C649B
MTRIFIIGNGFDMAHDLPTSYEKNLKSILKEKNPDLFELINNLYFIFDKNGKDYWSEFEKYLGKVTEDERKKLIEFIEEQINCYFQELPNIDDYSFSSDDDKFGDFFTSRQYAISEVEESNPSFDHILLNNINEIKEFISTGFNTMIDQANEYLIVAKPLKVENIDFKLDDLFINFNYTNTLESLYGIDPKNVLYVHGNTKQQLIWGNEQTVIDDLSIILKRDIAKIDTVNPEDPFKNDIIGHIRKQVDEGKIRHKEAAEAIVYYQEALEDENYMDYYASSTVNTEDLKKIESSILNLSYSMVKKPQLELLTEWIEEHDLIKLNLKEITVYGHSIGNVDKVYFETIESLLKLNSWRISYHEDTDIVLENLRDLSFKNKIETFLF